MGIKIVFQVLLGCRGADGVGIAFRQSGPNIQHGDSLR